MGKVKSSLGSDNTNQNVNISYLLQTKSFFVFNSIQFRVLYVVFFVFDMLLVTYAM